MYHHSNKKVIEADDIASVEALTHEPGKHGAPHKVHVTFALHHPKPEATMLHLTNGVDHRLLSPLPENQDAGAGEEASEEQTATTPLSSDSGSEEASSPTKTGELPSSSRRRASKSAESE